MRAILVGMMMLAAGALSVGCGGAEGQGEGTTLDAQRTSTASQTTGDDHAATTKAATGAIVPFCGGCGGSQPPCPAGYSCVHVDPRRTACQLDNPQLCGRGEPPCPAGFSCLTGVRPVGECTPDC